MKILKYILLLILLIGLAGFVFIATQPGNYSIIKTKKIAISKAVVFNFVSDFNTWNLWNPFYTNVSVETISESKKMYSLLTNNNTIVYETINSFETDSIYQKIKLKNESQDLVWKFQTTKKGTLITCEAKGTLTLKEKIVSFFYGGAQNYLGENFEISLNNIENYLVKELNSYNVTINGIVTQPECLYIAKKDSSSIKDFELNFKKQFPNIFSFAKENHLTYEKNPFIFYEKWDTINNVTKYKSGIYVKEEIITSEGSDIFGGLLPENKAVKVTLIGNHSHIKKAWKEAYNYIRKNRLSQNSNGNYIEIYKVYDDTEKQPSKWVTEIYIPIKLATRRRYSNTSSSSTESTQSTEVPSENANPPTE